MHITVRGVSRQNTLHIRKAQREESRDIASLFAMSSAGLSTYIWSQMADVGEDLLDVGTARYARDNTAFSYQNCWIAEASGTMAGMLHAFKMEVSDTTESDPVLRLYAELEAPGSLYIAGLAVLPEFRRKGVARRLLAQAETQAKSLGLEQLSLICFEQNAGARTLYAREGFREIARRPVVPHPSLAYSNGDALLLIRDIASMEAAP